MDEIRQRARALYQATEGRTGTDEKAVFQVLKSLDASERRALADEYRRAFGNDLVQVLRSELSGTKLKRAESLLATGKADWSGSSLAYRLEGMEDAVDGVVETVRDHPLISTGVLGGGVYLGVKAPTAAAVVGLAFLGLGAAKTVKNEVQARLEKTEEGRSRRLIASGEGLAQTLMALPGTGRSLNLVKGGIKTAAAAEGSLGTRAVAFLTYKPPRSRPIPSASRGEIEELGQSVAGFYQKTIKEALAPLLKHCKNLRPDQREALLAVAADDELMIVLARAPADPAATEKWLSSAGGTRRVLLRAVATDPAVRAGLKNLTKLFGPTLKALRSLPAERQRALLTLLTDPAALQLPPGELLVRLLVTMGPSHVKLGQIAADARGIPPDLATSLKKLQESLPALSEAEVARRLAAAGLAEKYRVGKVLGVASIGQVNEAVNASGQQVAIKVLRPGVNRATVEGEFRLLGALLKPYRGSLSPEKATQLDDALGSFKNGILEETDLSREAANMVQFAQAYPEQKAFTGVRLLEVADDGSVLVMTRSGGLPAKEIRGAVQRARAGENLAKAMAVQAFENGLFHADPHPGNFRVFPDGRIEFLDMGALGRISAAERFALQKTAVYTLAQDADRLASHLLEDAGSLFSRLPRGKLQAELAARIRSFFSSPDFDSSRLIQNLQDLMKVAEDLGVHQKKGSFWLVKTLYTANNVYRQLKPSGELALEAVPSILKGLYRSFREDPSLLRSHVIDLALVIGTHPRELASTLAAAGLADTGRLADIPRSFYVALQALRFGDRE